MRVEGIARLDEGVVPVGVQDLGPQVDVVPAAYEETGERVTEVRQAVAHHDLARHPDPRELRRLEPRDVHAAGIGRECTPCRESAGGVLHRLESC